MSFSILKALVLAALKTMATKLLTEKFLIALIVKLAEYLAGRSTNKFDDKLVADLKATLEAE